MWTLVPLLEEICTILNAAAWELYMLRIPPRLPPFEAPTFVRSSAPWEQPDHSNNVDKDICMEYVILSTLSPCKGLNQITKEHYERLSPIHSSWQNPDPQRAVFHTYIPIVWNVWEEIYQVSTRCPLKCWSPMKINEDPCSLHLKRKVVYSHKPAPLCPITAKPAQKSGPKLFSGHHWAFYWVATLKLAWDQNHSLWNKDIKREE